MKNKLSDLNNALFQQLENIQNPEEGTDVAMEIEKAKAITGISTNIINIHKLAYQAAKESGREEDFLETQFTNTPKSIDR
ncbi:MAG: hypothetical protein MUE53_10110 [Chitinophagales bacterium]|jgi:hypothetical protein|nr:hypothetical protein [Chitinophagales bacterium]